MKMFALCALSSTAVFLAGLGWQMGFSVDGQPAPVVGAAPVVAKIAPAKRLRFPQDLAPAAQAKTVEGAGTFTPGAGAHKLALMKPDGTLHEWHESIPEEWRSFRVQETELVVVVGSQKKIFVDENHFQNGPPIRRYIFEVTVSVVEPKTGKVVGYKLFRNMPRAIAQMEEFATTMIGRTVSWSFVYQWVASMCRIGFPEEFDTTPLVRQADI
jgi:hypothetical protein